MNTYKWLTNWRYRLFVRKIGHVKKAIAELCFKLFKVREMREERRKQYDRSVETLDALTKQLEKENKEETKKTLELKKEEQTLYQTQVKGQIDTLDMEITGSKEHGVQGVIEQIEAARELERMYKDYIAHNL